MSHTLKNYFDSVYIINMQSRLDRKTEILNQFQKIALDVDGNYIRFFSAIRPDSPEGFSSVGARGCFLSHLAVLTDALNRGVGNVLLIEDDCNFVQSFNKRLEHLQKTVPKGDWSLLYGGALNSIEPGKLKNGWLDPVQGVMGSHFIAVNGAVLANLVSYLEAMLQRPAGDVMGGPMHVDGAYSWFRAANPQCATYLAVPELAYQRSSATDIHQRKFYETNFAVQWMASKFRFLKNAVINFYR